MTKKSVGPGDENACIDMNGDKWGSVKIRHQGDGKAQGPWIGQL